MKSKLWLLIFAGLVLTALVIPSKASAESLTLYGLSVKVTDSVGVVSGGGTLSYASFPQTFYITASSTESGSKITIEVTSPQGKTVTANKFTVSNSSETGTYIITAKTEGGAIKKMAVHIKYEVKADSSSDYKYRTVALQIASISLNGRTVMSGLSTRVGLIGGTALDPSAENTLSKLINKTDGETYTLHGSLVVEVYTSKGVVGTYVVDKDWNRLVSDYEWIPKTLDAFRTMKEASTVYQAPRKVQTIIQWRDVTNGVVILDSITNNDIIKANEWVKMSAYINDADIDDEYKHVSTGYINKYADGTIEEIISGSAVKKVVYCYSHMDSVTVVFDYIRPNQRDMYVQGPGKQSYPEDEDVVTWVTIHLQGKEILPSDKVKVVIEIAELGYKYETDIICTENGSVKVPFKWHTPTVTATRNVSIKATVNEDRTVTEESYVNNTLTFVAEVQNMSYVKPKENKESYPVAPSRDTNSTITWTELRYEDGKLVTKEFYVTLDVEVNVDYTTKTKGYIRSGYGFTMDVKYNIRTNYDNPNLITDCQIAKVTLPQYTYWKFVYLERKSSSQWQFSRHADSPEGYRKEYVPVWWDDDEPYEIQVMCGELYTPGGVLNVWLTSNQDSQLRLNIEGSMYDDDHIGF